MAMTLALPRYVALKSKYNGKYLRYIHEDVQAHGFLQFSGEEVLSPFSKYEVEKSKNHEGLVHIRSCYNNKYWVRPSSNDWWIVAGADEPNEDRISWSCTLFQPVPVLVAGDGDDDTQTVRLRHVQLEHYACLSSEASPPLDNCLYARSTSPDIKLRDVCLVADLESLFVLPKYISFKGTKGKYLSGQTIKERPYLQFSSSAIADPTVRNLVSTTPDGSVRIKSLKFDEFWRRSSQDWIWADSSATTNDDPDTVFSPVRFEKNNNNVVALRNHGNKKFCKELTDATVSSCLSASAPTITDPETKLEVEELVVSRDIYDVKFRLMDARIYDLSVMLLATARATNETDQPVTKTLKFTYSETTSLAWKSSVSLKLVGVKLTLESQIPVISSGTVEISGHDFSDAYEWGKTISTTTPIIYPYSVIVPPRTTVTVSKLATHGSCDVPFSYSQRDTLMDGKPATYEFEDGIFTGVNYYDYKYETEQEPL